MSLDSVPRRRVLAAVSSASTLALAGCSLVPDEEPPPKLVIQNSSKQTATVSLTVENAESGEVVIDEDVTLKSDEDQPYEQPFTTGGKKSLTASLESGETKSYSWRTNPEQGPDRVAIDVNEDGEIRIYYSTA